MFHTYPDILGVRFARPRRLTIQLSTSISTFLPIFKRKRKPTPSTMNSYFFSILPKYELNTRPFFEFRQEFYHAIAKAKLRDLPNENWENYEYHELLDWALFSLFFTCLGPLAQKALFDNYLSPDRYLKHDNFQDYLRKVYLTFDRVTIPPYVDDYTPALTAIRYLYL